MTISNTIQHILTRMEACITEQESIILEEREALQTFDAATLTSLVERRARSQSTLNELEHQCQKLCSKVQHIQNKNQRMSYFIDHFAPEHADTLQSKRIELVRRMQTLEQAHIENHIRLRAAWNVTTSILQHVGAIEAKPTYGNPATQGSR